jgi:hypothetical protein
VVEGEGASPDEVAGDAFVFDLDGVPTLRRALEEGVPFMTTVEGAQWTLTGLERLADRPMRVRALQDVHRVPVQG